MSLIIEFIGGPWDGQRQAIPDRNTREFKIQRLRRFPPGLYYMHPKNMYQDGLYRRAEDSPPLKDGAPQPWPFHWEGWQ